MQPNNTEPRRLATFHTHTGAMKFERALKARGISCLMKPVPRKLSSSCGVCVEYTACSEEGLPLEDVSRIYSIDGNVYHLIMENE